MELLVLAAAQSNVGLYGGLMVLGLLIGVFGHIIRSRTLILAGIIVIGAVSVYFGFVVAKVR